MPSFALFQLNEPTYNPAQLVSVYTEKLPDTWRILFFRALELSCNSTFSSFSDYGLPGDKVNRCSYEYTFPPGEPPVNSFHLSFAAQDLSVVPPKFIQCAVTMAEQLELNCHDQQQEQEHGINLLWCIGGILGGVALFTAMYLLVQRYCNKKAARNVADNNEALLPPESPTPYSP